MCCLDISDDDAWASNLLCIREQRMTELPGIERPKHAIIKRYVPMLLVMHVANDEVARLHSCYR